MKSDRKMRFALLKSRQLVYALRGCERVLQVARLCEAHDVGHVINNAYGVQSAALCKLARLCLYLLLVDIAAFCRLGLFSPLIHPFLMHTAAPRFCSSTLGCRV